MKKLALLLLLLGQAILCPSPVRSTVRNRQPWTIISLPSLPYTPAQRNAQFIARSIRSLCSGIKAFCTELSLSSFDSHRSTLLRFAGITAASIVLIYHLRQAALHKKANLQAIINETAWLDAIDSVYDKQNIISSSEDNLSANISSYWTSTATIDFDHLNGTDAEQNIINKVLYACRQLPTKNIIITKQSIASIEMRSDRYSVFYELTLKTGDRFTISSIIGSQLFTSCWMSFTHPTESIKNNYSTV
jgi:hypothetical protein